MGSNGKKDACFVVGRINIQTLRGKRECQGAGSAGGLRAQRVGYCSNRDCFGAIIKILPIPGGDITDSWVAELMFLCVVPPFHCSKNASYIYIMGLHDL